MRARLLAHMENRTAEIAAVASATALRKTSAVGTCAPSHARHVTLLVAGLPTVALTVAVTVEIVDKAAEVLDALTIAQAAVEGNLVMCVDIPVVIRR